MHGADKDKVLIVTPFYPPNIGGAETFAEDLGKALDKKYEVFVSTIKWNKQVTWKGLNYIKAIWLYIRLWLSTRQIIKRYRFKRIYALGLIATAVAVKFNVEVYSVILASYDFKKVDRKIANILNRARKVFTEGKNGKLDMVQVGVHEHRIVLFNHWVNQKRFCYKPKNNDTLTVLFVGRPIKIKGEHIVRATEKLTHGINYIYVNEIVYDRLHEYYQKADICIVPSLYSEGFSRVVVEAANCGCFVIASNKGSLPELVRPFGYCIEPEPELLTGILLGFARNKKYLKYRQEATAEYAKNNFSEANAEVFL